MKAHCISFRAGNTRQANRLLVAFDEEREVRTTFIYNRRKYRVFGQIIAAKKMAGMQWEFTIFQPRPLKIVSKKHKG